MNWYTGKVLLRCEVRHEKPRKAHPFEESYFLIRAPSHHVAARKAERVGKLKEHSYKNRDGNEVIWRFVRVLEVQEVLAHDLEEGVEVFSKFVKGRTSLRRNEPRRENDSTRRT
jgi:hypothetical protein